VPEEFLPAPILNALAAHDVDFVLIGGLAGVARGSAYATFDVDIAYARDAENLERLAAALQELGATLRGAPPDVPFLLDAETIAKGAHFTFDTRYGSLDILTDPDGAPPFAGLVARSDHGDVDGVTVRIASLDHLIAMKEASGRTKDKLMATEYRVISDELRAPRDG
jgi:hypothetical protein